ncbi:unnamed protein product, partial [Staurois parvus]
MSGQYRYPPNVRIVQISPQMSGQYRYPPNVRRYRYPPNVRTVQISPKCQDGTDIPPKCQDRTDIPQMSGQDSFCKVDNLTYAFHKRHDKFFLSNFFVI